MYIYYNLYEKIVRHRRSVSWYIFLSNKTREPMNTLRVLTIVSCSLFSISIGEIINKPVVVAVGIDFGTSFSIIGGYVVRFLYFDVLDIHLRCGFYWTDKCIYRTVKVSRSYPMTREIG